MNDREVAEDVHLLPERYWRTNALVFSQEEMDAVMVSMPRIRPFSKQSDRVRMSEKVAFILIDILALLFVFWFFPALQSRVEAPSNQLRPHRNLTENMYKLGLKANTASTFSHNTRCI